MRYLAIAFVLLSYPGFVYLLKTNPRHRHWAYFFIGMLPFTVQVWNLDCAIINWPTWLGYSKGVILNVVDTLALAIVTTQRTPRGIPPLMGWVILYMAAVALAIAFANLAMPAFFYFCQLMRFAIILMAVAKIVANPRALQWLAMGLACGMMYEFVITANQKLNGAFQAPGTMEHQNQLGMMTHFVALPLLGMLLGGQRSRVLMLGVAAAFPVVIFGASRATIGFIAVGVVLVLALSLIRHSTRHKKRMAGFAIVVMIVAAPFLAQSLSKRLAQEYENRSDYDERAAFEHAAELIWQDHPMGIGANNYVVVANTGGYSARAGVTWTTGSRSTSVHNTYLLAAAETGWAGLITFVAMLAAFIIGGWRCAFSNRNDPRGDVALGATVAIAMMAAHAKYEWITMTYPVQYLLGISMGMISGLIRVQALERKEKAGRKRAAALQAQREALGKGAIA